MPTRAITSYGIHAIASFLGAGGGGSFDRQRGFVAAFVRNGAGDYSFALQAADAIDATPAQHVLFATAANGAAAMVDAVIVDGTHIRVRTFSGANMAADMRFSVMILDLGVN